jgi:hypothetical protein
MLTASGERQQTRSGTGQGIDTVAFMVPYEPYDRYRADLDGIRVYPVGLEDLRVEVSVARYAFGNNRRLLPPSDLPEVLDEILGAVLPKHTRKLPATARLRASRVDYARDFYSSPDDVTGALRRIGAIPSRGPYTTITSAKHGSVQTVRLGPTHAWHVRTYDKGVESGRPRSGQLRFEVQLRRDRLASPWTERVAGQQIRTIGDISEEAIRTVARESFDLVGLATAFKGGPGLTQAVDAIPGLTPAIRSGLHSFCVARLEGIRWFQGNTRYKYERLAREHGLEGLGHDPTHDLVLDWDLGLIIQQPLGLLPTPSAF